MTYLTENAEVWTVKSWTDSGVNLTMVRAGLAPLTLAGVWAGSNSCGSAAGHPEISRALSVSDSVSIRVASASTVIRFAMRNEISSPVGGED